MAESAALLVDEVLPEAPMRQWVLSFPFPLRFLFASRPEIMGKVLGIVYRVLPTHLIRTAGFTHKTARTGAVTLIQRFGGALNLNVHFHMLFLDGVYVDDARSGTRFRWVKAPTHAELTQLSHTIAHRVISTSLIKRSGKTVKSGAQSGAVTLIQRFGSALNLNLHFHMLYLNGIYDANGYFWPVKPRQSFETKTKTTLVVFVALNSHG